MEEESKRNFQAIVNKFSQPAAIKEGNRVAQSKIRQQPFFVEPDATNCPLKPSTISNCLLSDADNKDDMLIYKNYNFEEIRDSATQTSKTIIELAAQLESGEMSPDSLSCSPRTSSTDYSFNLHASQTDDDHRPKQTWMTHKISHDEECCSGHATYATHSSLITKYSAPKGYHLPPNIVEPLELHKTDRRPKHPNQSLIETFLRKNKDRGEFHEEQLYEPKNNDFKSRSCVESFQQVSHGGEKAHPQITRFTVKNASRVPIKASFMMPTQASQQRNIGGEMEKIKSLISPTRRGRSISPRATPRSNRAEKISKGVAIPYIDQSDTDISKPHKSPKKSSSPKSLPQLTPPSNFALDMTRIDRMSLTLLSSDDNFLSDPKTSDRVSTTSIDSLYSVLTKLQDNEWSTSVKGLADVTELCRSADPDVMMPHMVLINQKLIDLLKSPRSHVCRTACQAAGHLFESMKDTRGPEFNDIVDILLTKTADSNKFIRQDANLALDCMVTHIPTFHSVRVLCSKGPLNKNQLVRSACARLVICAVVIAGPDSVLSPHNNDHTRKRVYVNMIKFLEDKNLETRKYGERLYKVLSKEPTFDHYLKKYIDRADLERMKKTLKFLSRK